MFCFANAQYSLPPKGSLGNNEIIMEYLQNKFEIFKTSSKQEIKMYNKITMDRINKNRKTGKEKRIVFKKDK